MRRGPPSWGQRERDAIADLSVSQGWQVLRSWLDEIEEACIRDLASADFADLLRVGRLQGQVTAIRRIRDAVEKRMPETT